MSKAGVVVARLTVERSVGVKTIIEVHEDATFMTFFHYFTQEGRRRSTKREVRTANRNEGLVPHWRAAWMTPGLEVLARLFEGMKHITSVKVRVIKKGAYRRLIEASPDVLGLTKVKSQPDPRLERETRGIPVYIPQGHTTIKRKWSILTSRKVVPA
jgi:hypothetical protein